MGRECDISWKKSAQMDSFAKNFSCNFSKSHLGSNDDDDMSLKIVKWFNEISRNSLT